MTAPKAPPKPAHAKDTIRNTEELGSNAKSTPSMAIITIATLAVTSFFFSSSLIPKNSPIIFSDTDEAAASICESAVDIVAASTPARITPARIAVSIPCSEISPASLTMMVSADEALSRYSSTPALVTPSPTTPITIAAPIAMNTHTVATLLLSLSLFSSSIAMNLRRI